MTKSWIKVPLEIARSHDPILIAVYNNIKSFAIFSEKFKWSWCGKELLLTRGQRVLTLKSLAKWFKTTEAKVRRVVEIMVGDGTFRKSRLGTGKRAEGTLITVLDMLETVADGIADGTPPETLELQAFKEEPVFEKQMEQRGEVDGDTIDKTLTPPPISPTPEEEQLIKEGEALLGKKAPKITALNFVSLYRESRHLMGPEDVKAAFKELVAHPHSKETTLSITRVFFMDRVRRENRAFDARKRSDVAQWCREFYNRKDEAIAAFLAHVPQSEAAEARAYFAPLFDEVYADERRYG